MEKLNFEKVEGPPGMVAFHRPENRDSMRCNVRADKMPKIEGASVAAGGSGMQAMKELEIGRSLFYSFFVSSTYHS